MADPIPQGEGTILGGNRSGPLESNGTTLYSSLCISGWTNRHAVLNEDSGGPTEPCKADPLRGRGNFWGLYERLKSIGNLYCNGRCSIAAKGVIQLPITSCSRRDHSVCPASAKGILKISGHRISPKVHAQSLPNLFCMLPMAVARSSSGGMTKSQGEGAILGVFFPIDHALYSIAFGNQSRCRLGWWLGWALGTMCWVIWSPRWKGNVWGRRSGPL